MFAWFLSEGKYRDNCLVFYNRLNIKSMKLNIEVEVEVEVEY